MLALALSLLAATPPDASPAMPLAGGRSVPLDLQVEVVSREEERRSFPRLAWHLEGDSLVGTADDGRCAATVRLAPEAGGLALEVSLRYDGAATVGKESVRLRLPGRGLALGPDLALHKLLRPLRVDRGTPVFLATADVALAGGAGLAAARYLPLRNGVEVELILDDAAARPFAVYDRCLDRLPGLGRGGVMTFAALEHKRLLGEVRRRPGDAVLARATLHPIAPGREVLPLVAERWAAGARAALVFTDHADRTDPLALRALLHGDSRLVCREGGPLGFLGHGLRITKSFFVRAPVGGLDDPEAAALAAELHAAGSEVASHSPSGDPDDRDSVRGALPALARYGVVTWIDHEPYTNCEAFSSRGWEAEGRYAIRDLLAAAGFLWVWEAGDVGGFGPDPALVNLFTAGDPGEARVPMYPLPMDRRLWAFQSTMFYGPPARLAAALGELSLLRLEAERGLFVAHTYLAASARTTVRAEHLGRLLVRELPDGALELDPVFDTALARVAAHVRAGRLASLTWAEAGERLRALGAVEVSYLSDGSAEVTNRGQAPVAGLTLAAPAGGLELSVEGAEVSGADGDAESSRIWFDLPAGATVAVRAEQRGLPVPFLPAAAGALGSR